MAGLEQKSVRRAEARATAAGVVEKRSSTETGARIKGYQEGGVLTGRESDHVADELQAAAYELIDELYDRIEALESAPKTKSAAGKK